MSNLLSDAVARQAALDPQRSVVVTAPAGSGKTELLARRILVLLAHVDEPEDILAITFTRKAAAEMRERVLRYLRWELDAKRKYPDDDVRPLVDAVLAQNQLKQWQLLNNPQRLRVQTIDSFTGSLIANLPLQSGFGGRPAVQEDARSLYCEAVRQLLQSLETDENLSATLGVLLRHVDNRFATLESLLVMLLAKRDQWLVLLGSARDVPQARDHFQATLQQLVESHLHAAYEKLMPLSAALMELVDYACQQHQRLNPDAPLLALQDTAGLPEVEANQLDQWRLLYQFLFTQSGELRKEKGITKKNGFPSAKTDVDDVAYAKQRKQAMVELLNEIATRKELIDTLQPIAILPSPQYADQQWTLLSALMVVLPRLIFELKIVFARRSEVDFTEQSLSALDAIQKADLRYKVDSRLKHILVDEFQDTSVVQFKLLKSLVAEWDGHNFENPHAPRTLFIVGDGMQSIYGFRAADVGLFLEARQKGIGPVGLNPLELTVNFRSSPVVVNWVNAVFSRLFPGVDNPDLGASKHVMAKAKKTESGEVVLRGFVDDIKNQAQTQYCVELINSLQKNHAEGTIVVLVRAKAHLHDLIAQLTQANIAWQATDIAPLVGRPVVQDLLMLLRALANPADRIAWLAILRSPLCGLTNHDLFSLIAQSDSRAELKDQPRDNNKKLLEPIVQRVMNHDVVQLLEINGQQLISRLADVLNAAETTRERKSLRPWLESIWLGLGGAKAYENIVNGDDPWQEADAFFSLLESKLAHLCDFDQSAFEESLSKLFVKPQVANDRATVQLMTMHKAKGLEFDSVILPYLNRTTKSDDQPLLIWDGFHSEDCGEPKLLLAVKPERGGTADSVYDYLLHKRAQRSALEQVRLLYVSATRAKSRLYLSYGGARNAEGDILPPSSSSLLAKLVPAFDQGELLEQWNASWNQISSDSLVVHNKNILAVNNSSVNTLRQLQPTWRAITAEIKTHIGEAPVVTGIQQWQESRVARAVGIAVHKVLELSALKAPMFWACLNSTQQSDYLARLLEQELPNALLAEAVSKVQAQLKAVFADQKALWILDANHQQSKSEWPLFSMAENQSLSFDSHDVLSQSVIDRCFIEDNVCWLVDYKTSEPLPDQSLEDFLQSEARKYQKKMHSYAKLLVAHYHLSVRTALYFTAMAHFYELNLSS